MRKIYIYIYFAELAICDSFDASKMKGALMRSRILESDELDGLRLRQQIRLYVPIGFVDEVYETLPADLVNNLTYRTVIDVLFLL